MVVLQNPILRAGLTFWPVLMAVAVLNGVARTQIWEQMLAKRTAEWLSVLILLILLYALIAWFLARRERRYSVSDLWRLGALWTAMSFIFELALFHWAYGLPLDVLLATYNPLSGKPWSEALLGLFIGPRLVGAWMDAKRRHGEDP
ncbi:MAG: hypothetical protein D6782_09020 [Alphaproteobacteria bacterium]|nr:MAG: hypothetical protein D6782_09020 [Alphaproteobacteria bacterium]